MKVRLTAETPLHIGGRESVLNPLEFAVKDKRCYVVSEDKFARALQEKGKLDFFSTWFDEQTDLPVLRDFLQGQKLLKEEFLQQISNYSSASPTRIKTEIRPFIRDGFQRPYLPGTSIKGALRTAFLYGILKNMDETQRRKILHDFVKDRLNEFEQGRKKPPKERRWSPNSFKKEFARRMEESIFQRFSLGKERQRFGPNTDILRCLRITDSKPSWAKSAKIETVKVFSARSKKPPESLYVECLPEGSSCEFEITIDEKTLAEFDTNSPDLEKILRDPLTAWKDMGKALWQEDDGFFSSEFNHETVQMPDKDLPLVRLGWGSGLLGTTVDMLLDESDVQRIRDTLFIPRYGTPAPKSRRLAARQGNTYLPLGWAKVKVVP